MAEPLTLPAVPALLVSSDKITGSHLGRDAYVYVRQSTPTQVVVHTESLQRQYELRERALGLGWPAHQVVVIDADLGRSGARTDGRLGFSELVADVGLGKVGIVLGIEVSRLARNNADWYQLLDLCALTDTLIADADGVYHPADFNDRLVLGLKGTMSEAELHLIRSRLTAGLKHKAAKGELRQGLPVGLDYDTEDRVIITPDEAVVEAIATVFRRFDELGSARQVLLALREDGLLLPRRRNGSTRITWQSATYPAVHDFLTNPAYAGAFVFGRTRTEKRVDATGRVIAQVRLLPREEWAVLIPDHHSGFITWDKYEANTQLLRDNWRAPRGHGGGAPREGRALLQGLLQCGKCGRTMQTGYSGPQGNSPRYVCARAQQLYGTGPGCQSIGGGRLEKTILEQLFAILEPASLEATAKALAEADAHYRQRLAAFELAVERARYEAERAHRQYDAVEPENRLVARTLEHTLEDKLAAHRRAENDLAAQRAKRPVTLTTEEVAWIQQAGADVAKLFHADTTTIVERKQLIRAVIDHIVLTIHAADDDRVADLNIIWRGGASTKLSMPMTKRGGHTRTTDEDTLTLVRRLAKHYDDKTIALILSKQRRRTATGLNWTKTRVKTLRISHGISAYQPPAPENVGADGQDVVVVTVPNAAEILGVSKYTIYRWLRDGFLVGEQLTPAAPWQIRIDQQLRDRIRPEAPHGWLPLDQAAHALGIARQTVLHKVQRGQLPAVYVNRGRRQGLRIQVKPDQTGLFDTPR
jgi:DNA invertase Pin-like site-specific DNA recombinase/predicted DNA-binding transcriptional regulator AlpA